MVITENNLTALTAFYSNVKTKNTPVVVGMAENSPWKPGHCTLLSVMKLIRIMLLEETTASWLVGGRWPHCLLMQCKKNM